MDLAFVAGGFGDQSSSRCSPFVDPPVWLYVTEAIGMNLKLGAVVQELDGDGWICGQEAGVVGFLDLVAN